MNNQLNNKEINKQAKEGLGYLTGMDTPLQEAVLSMRLKSCGTKDSEVVAKEYISDMKKTAGMY